MIRAAIILFGAYVGTICPAPTVVMVLLLSLLAMTIGMCVERALIARTTSEA